MTTFYIDRPVPFAGSAEESRINYDSHAWNNYDDEIVCCRCDAKPWHVVALYPCGTEPPREVVEG